MVRETRGSITKDSQVDSTPGIKRKRRQSPPPISTPLKVILPSPNSIAQSSSQQLSPPKVNGESAKRQRISLKVNGSGRKGSKSPVPEPALASEAEAEAEDGVGELDGKVKEDVVMEEVKEEPVVKKGRLLGKDIRAALALVISQMATDLPPPLNGILSLWLPPDFVQKKENTLGFVLGQEELTWEALVDLLHVFSQNLLVPCAYPNPVPSLSQFHLPVPPLPSHYPPLVIYTFCASLHSLLLSIEPDGSGAGVDAERWALMQRTPGSSGGDWFTSSVDIRSIGDALEKENVKQESDDEKGTLLERWAATGDKFGYASAVAIQSAMKAPSCSTVTVPTLSESLIHRASLKANRWKEQRLAKRAGGFGSIVRGVTVPAVASTSFTPSFAPSYDSTFATGGLGYYSTLDAMHERRRRNDWAKREKAAAAVVPEKGYWGSIEADVAVGEGSKTTDKKGKGKARDVDGELAENARLINEFNAWQDLRVRRNEVDVSTREQQIADEVLASLTRLAENIPPADLLRLPQTPGSAHELAKRFIHVSSPVIRGTLDPRRPHALHDNTTVRARPQQTQSLGASTANYSSPRTATNYMAPPPLPVQYTVPPPHTASGGPSRQQHYSSPTPRSTGYYPTTATPQGQPYRPTTAGYTPYTPPSNPAYGRTGSESTGLIPVTATAYTRPGPGPSSLRQSFGPLPGTPGSPYASGGPGRPPSIILAARQQFSGGTPSRV